MGFFHPNNNLGLEVFFIGILFLIIVEVLFFLWIWYSDNEWKRKNGEKE